MRRDENIHESTVLKYEILSPLEPLGPVQGFTNKIHANLNYEDLNMYCKYTVNSGVVKLNKSHQNVWEAGTVTAKRYSRSVFILILEAGFLSQVRGSSLEKDC